MRVLGAADGQAPHFLDGDELLAQHVLEELGAAGPGVRDQEIDRDVGQPGRVDPEVAVDPAPVEHLDQELEVLRPEEPEAAGVRREGDRVPHAVGAVGDAPERPYLEAAALETERPVVRRAGEHEEPQHDVQARVVLAPGIEGPVELPARPGRRHDAAVGHVHLRPFLLEEDLLVRHDLRPERCPVPAVGAQEDVLAEVPRLVEAHERDDEATGRIHRDRGAPLVRRGFRTHSDLVGKRHAVPIEEPSVDPSREAVLPITLPSYDEAPAQIGAEVGLDLVPRLVLIHQEALPERHAVSREEPRPHPQPDESSFHPFHTTTNRSSPSVATRVTIGNVGAYGSGSETTISSPEGSPDPATCRATTCHGSGISRNQLATNPPPGNSSTSAFPVPYPG